MSWHKLCTSCAAVPVAFTTVEFCFACWPSGPAVAPPCLRCSSTVAYFTNGLCGRCHQRGPDVVDTCLDCYAWGATRHRAWRCIGCDGFRQRRPLGTCISCARSDIPVTVDGACRLCRKQRTRMLIRASYPLPDVIATSSKAQQLFFADMFALKGPSVRRRGPQPRPPPPPEVALPVRYRQQKLFAWPLDLLIMRDHGFAEPANPAITHTMIRHVDAHAEHFGWSKAHHSKTRAGMRILLSLQETPGAPIRWSEVAPMAKIDYSVQALCAVLATADMLEDDRQPPILAWFGSQTVGLPDPMRDELDVWFNVMRHGSSTTPRRRPRDDTATANQARIALPYLRHWAKTHDTLREISNHDIRDIIPTQGWQRAATLGALRSIFRILKDNKLVFTNPTARFHAHQPNQAIPDPIGLAKVRAAIEADDPARGAVSALLAFHGIRTQDLRSLLLTDLHDGRLQIRDQQILLAGTVRDCLAAWLDHRHQRWPNTKNPHLFINYRSATHTHPVNDGWIGKTVSMPPDTIRRDRILDEASPPTATSDNSPNYSPSPSPPPSATPKSPTDPDSATEPNPTVPRPQDPATLTSTPHPGVRRKPSRSYQQPLVCVANVPLGGADAVLDDGRVVTHSPQGTAPCEAGQDLGFDVGETEQGSRFGNLVRGLAEQDAGLGVGEDAHRDLGGRGAVVALRSEVGDSVGDGDVRHAVAPRQLLA